MLSEIKLWIGAAVLFVIVGLSIFSYVEYTEVVKLKTELSTAVVNNKAYEAENDSLKNKNLEFNFTISQLNQSADSLVRELNRVRKELKIKDRNLKELQYIASHNSKIDTVHVRDTIFKDTEFSMDTIIEDAWAKLELHMEYPNEITANYSFRNETVVVASSRKETVNPSHECWFVRLFQKKHKVVEVEVIQNNPYCENDFHKHIKIID